MCVFVSLCSLVRSRRIAQRNRHRDDVTIAYSTTPIIGRQLSERARHTFSVSSARFFFASSSVVFSLLVLLLRVFFFAFCRCWEQVGFEKKKKKKNFPFFHWNNLTRKSRLTIFSFSSLRRTITNVRDMWSKKLIFVLETYQHSNLSHCFAAVADADDDSENELFSFIFDFGYLFSFAE